MKRLLQLTAISLGALSAASPLAATAEGQQSGDLFHRMTQVNAHLRSYKADLHADVALKTFPYLSPSLDGNVYYKQPDKQAVVFDTVPALAAQFKKVYPRLEPPSQWPSLYSMSTLGDQNGITTFRLVPRKHGRVQHLDVRTDDSTATIKSMTWTYEDGGYVTFDETLQKQNNNYLIKTMNGHVELPAYKADVVLAYSNYKLNVPVSDSVFSEK
ncbi:MAG: hypothetical protein JO043_04155 [Candidatus Eremiobacteraeota bacterium]|nr:hypothetical protein [Candidatus Eremiobacteraeota bacterium]